MLRKWTLGENVIITKSQRLDLKAYHNHRLCGKCGENSLTLLIKKKNANVRIGANGPKVGILNK